MATAALLEFLKTQNRPFNLNQIIPNLKEHPKASLQKALEKLVENGQVIEKINAKQKIYCIVQKSDANSKDLLKLDKELQVHANELEKKLQNVQAQVNAKEAELDKLNKSLTIEELKSRKEEMLQKIRTAKKKLDTLMTTSSNQQQDLPKRKRKLEKDVETFQREYSKRKRKCLDVLDSILEHYPKNKQSLYEDVGIQVVNL